MKVCAKTFQDTPPTMRVPVPISLLVATAVAAEMRSILYDRAVFPPTWHLVTRASQHQRMHLVVAVKQQNLEILEKMFWAVSDPKSKRWQEFMQPEEIGKIVAAKAMDMDTVMTWLTSLSKDALVKPGYDAIDIRASVKDVEQLFHTELYVFTHDNGHTIIRAMGPHSVPASVREAIDFVEGISEFPMHRSAVQRKTVHARNDQNITAIISPRTLLELYSVPDLSTDSKVSQGPAEFQGEPAYTKPNLKSFFEQMDIPVEAVDDIVGPYDAAFPGIESTLDIQYLMGVGQKQVDWYWTSDNWMYTWARTFATHRTVPDAVSMSWGWAEDAQCSAMLAQSMCSTLGINSEQYVKRVNIEFQKIGLRGVSLIVCTQDSGANGKTDMECTDDKLHAAFPGSSPYVTAVGATMLTKPEFNLENPPKACSSLGSQYECASGGKEVAVSFAEASFTSGGGFSTYSPMPSFQKQAVNTYLSSMAGQLPPASYFNRTNRAFPDISANGNNFLINADGWSLVGGTSASTPTFAGIAARLNDLSYKKKSKPLGFLNPLLYQMYDEAPQAFTDITVGSNECTEAGCFPSCKGYVASPGWDPVTGLGTPVTDKMMAYVQKLLEKSINLSV